MASPSKAFGFEPRKNYFHAPWWRNDGNRTSIPLLAA